MIGVRGLAPAFAGEPGLGRMVARDPLDVENTIGRDESKGGDASARGRMAGRFRVLRVLGRGEMG